MRAFYFYSVIFGFFAGVFCAEFARVSLVAFAAIAGVALAIAAFLFLHSRIKAKPFAHPIMIFAVFAFALPIGGMRMDLKLATFQNNPLQSFLGQSVTLAGIADDDVGISDSNAKIKIYAIDVGNGAERISPQEILLKYPKAEMKYGDLLVISGEIAKPENFKTDQGAEFDYISYLKKDGVQFVLKNPKIIHREEGEISLFSILHAIKTRFISNVESLVPEPESALSAGVTIAGKGALPADVKEDFIRSGVIHIVVLSGYNIAVVVAAIIAMFGFLGLRIRSLIAIFAISLFVIISGGAAPVVRSAIMAGIALIGALSYTPILQNRALFGAALIMVFINPLIFSRDAAFALSFLATFAIINLVKIVEPYLSFVSDRFQIKKTLAETLATQIFVLPYLLYQIGRLSIIAPVSNILILPFIPYIMLLCFIVGMLAFIPFVVLPIAGALFILSYIVIYLAHIFASLPFASFNISISLWTMIFIYICYFGVGYYFTASSKRREEIS